MTVESVPSFWMPHMVSNSQRRTTPLGVVVQGRNAAVEGGAALPRLPNDGGTVLGHEQPTQHLLVFQQLIGVFDINVRQHIQNQRRGQEARDCRRPVRVPGADKFKEKLNIGVKIGIVAVLVIVLALIFWVCFFRSSGVTAADSSASQDRPTQSEEPTQTDIPAPTETPTQAGEVFLQLDGAGAGEGNDWLKCHATLLTDGTFTIAVDYNAKNPGIETDSGTWVENGDGSLTLTGTRDFTVTLADGVYAMEVTNAETGIVCELSGNA